MPMLETYASNPEISWAQSDLSHLLEKHNPSDLPNAICLSDSSAPATPTEYEYPRRRFVVILPTLEGTAKEEYVLRVEKLKRGGAMEQLLVAEREFTNLGQIAVEHDLPQFIPPRSVFFQDAPSTLTVFTVLPLFDRGQNLRHHLKIPASQDVLLGIGEVLTAYFSSKTPGDSSLADISGHYQSSVSGTLLDLEHEFSTDPDEIRDDLGVMHKWARGLLPSDRRASLITAIKEAKRKF